MTSPNEAFVALEQQELAAEQQTKSAASIGKRMLDVLQSRGELIIARHGLYGGTAGLIGSAHPGQRLTQSTVPVSIGGGNYVALRNPFLSPDEDEPRYAVELIKTKVAGPGYCIIEPEQNEIFAPDPVIAEFQRSRALKFTEDDVIAGYIAAHERRHTTASLEIGGTTEMTAGQLEAVSTLVSHIEDSLDPIHEDWQQVAKKLPYEPRIAYDVSIREGANLVGDLDIYDFYFA